LWLLCLFKWLASKFKGSVSFCGKIGEVLRYSSLIKTKNIEGDNILDIDNQRKPELKNSLVLQQSCVVSLDSFLYDMQIQFKVQITSPILIPFKNTSRFSVAVAIHGDCNVIVDAAVLASLRCGQFHMSARTDLVSSSETINLSCDKIVLLQYLLM
jgi:hypothetical protein